MLRVRAVNAQKIGGQPFLPKAGQPGQVLRDNAVGGRLQSASRVSRWMAYVSGCGGDTAHWKRFWEETDAAPHAEETRAEPCTARPAARGTELASPAAAPAGAAASPRSRSGDALTRFFPAVAGAVGVAGIAGVAGLTGCRPRTATLTVVAGACMASGFWLGRKLRYA